MKDRKIETIEGGLKLADGYKKIKRGTFQEASQIQNQRRVDDPQMKHKSFYTANLGLYKVAGFGKLKYGLSGRKTFDAIAGKKINEFVKQLLENDVYKLTDQQIEELEKLESDIVWVNAKDLYFDEDLWSESYFKIYTQRHSPSELKSAQLAFAVKVHGSMDSKYDPEQSRPDYHENINMLSGIAQTRIWLANPEFIKKRIIKGEVIAMASKLGDIGGMSSEFWATVNHFGVSGAPGNALRGVPT